mmetsp:Transcript_36758/g.109776  ORF Transcript_36758/g.109776 Transcript_36758/m.109776 type:complete len:351 (-) Transcript_36758:33-1085(-)
MAGGDGVEVHALALLEGSEDRASIRPHEAVVVQCVVGQQLLDALRVHEVFRAVVHPEGVAGVQEPGAVVEGEHRVRPVEVRGDDKLQLMAAAQVELSAVVHHLALERGVDQVLEELNADLRAHNGEVLVARRQGLLHDLADEAGVVRLRVRHNEVRHGGVVHLLVHCVEEEALKLLVRSVDNGHLVRTPDDVRVVGRAPLQGELDVEAVAVPVEGADSGRVRRHVLNGHRLQPVLLARGEACPGLRARERRGGGGPCPSRRSRLAAARGKGPSRRTEERGREAECARARRLGARLLRKPPVWERARASWRQPELRGLDEGRGQHPGRNGRHCCRALRTDPRWEIAKSGPA